MFPGAPKPKGLHPFIALDGGAHVAPSTPGDLVLHVRGKRFDMCFELGDKLLERLGGLVDVADRLQGFRYVDERDLLGFVDGTESPSGEEAWQTVTITGDEPFDGGSYLITQRYLHDLTSWNALTVEQQDTAIGRHKLDDIEIPDAKKASNSHVALNSINAPTAPNSRSCARTCPSAPSAKPTAPTSSAMPATGRSPSACCTTCSSATQWATTTAFSTSRPRSRAACSTFPPSISGRPDAALMGAHGAGYG